MILHLLFAFFVYLSEAILHSETDQRGDDNTFIQSLLSSADEQQISALTTMQTNIPRQTPVSSSQQTQVQTPQQTNTLTPQQTKISTPQQTEVLTPQQTEILTPQHTEIPTPHETEVLTPQQTEDLTPQQTESLTPQQTEIITPQQTEIITPQQTESLTPQQTESLTPQQTPISTYYRTQPPTEPPTSEIDSSRIIYVCEGISCDNCGKTDKNNHETQLTSYSLLDELLSRNDQNDIQIGICGSTRENHPSISVDRIYEKRVEIQGNGEHQYITFLNVTHYSDEDLEIEAAILIKVNDVTIIVDESNNDKKNMFIYLGELENSPIEVENLTILDGDLDLASLSAVKNSIFAVSAHIIDDSISQIKLGSNYMSFYRDGKSSQPITFHEYDLPMDIRSTIKRTTLKFSVDQNFHDTLTQSNIVIDLKNDVGTKATISFDSTWNGIQKIEFILIKHYCNLEIVSDDKEVAKKIDVDGDGIVIRNGVIDGDDGDDGGDDRDDDGGSGSDGESGNNNSFEKDGVSYIVAFIAVAVLALVAYGVYKVCSKKCKRPGRHNYNDYLTNAEDLGNIDDPL